MVSKITAYYDKISVLIKKYQTQIICIVLCVAFVLGIFVTFDYGAAFDDPIQRQHSLISYNYVYSLFMGNTITNAHNTNFQNYYKIPELSTYKHKYYGVAIQLPLVFIEHLSGFTLDSRSVYLIRHICIFLIFFISVICMYFLAKMLFKSCGYAFLAALMLYLYPRLFAHAHFNIKDSVFASLFTISLFIMVLFMQNRRKIGYGILFGFTVALASNSRIIATMILCGTICLMLLEDISVSVTKRKGVALDHLVYDYSMPQRILPYAVILVSFVFFLTLSYPASWSNPFVFFLETFDKFVIYDSWGASWPFMGEMIRKSTMPWYYLSVWLGVSIPLVYLFMFVAGFFSLFINFFKRGVYGLLENRYYWVIFGFFLLPFGATIIKKGLIHTDWRHVFFLFPPMVLIAAYGIKKLTDYLYGLPVLKSNILKSLAIIAMSISLVMQTGWMIKNHPFQNVYFNVIGRPMAPQMDRDRLGLSLYQLASYLLETVDGDIRVSLKSNDSTVLQMFTPEEKSRFDAVKLEDADYALDFYFGKMGNDIKIDGFEEIHCIWVDGFKIGSVYKRK